MELAELLDRLRAWARRYEPRSPERVLFLASAEKLETMQQRIAEAGAGDMASASVDEFEAAMGVSLMPWQRKKLEERARLRQTPPPSSEA